jgi:hypothetical protein
VSETDYFGAVQAAGDGQPSWAASQNAEPVDSTEPAEAAGVPPASDQWEPLPSQSLEQRVEAMESWLGPRVIDTERAEELGRYQQLVDQAHGMSAAELAGLAAQATEAAVTDRLGLVQQPAGIEQFLAAGEEIAAAHVPEWNEVRDQVFAEMQARPQWLMDAHANPTPAVLGQTFVSVAATMRAAEGARSQMAEAKRQAQTMSGGSSRPATQTADEEYWAAVRSAGSGGYR